MSGADDSFIEVGKHATTFVGPDATLLFAATSLRGAIGFYLKTRMKVSRLHTPTAMLAAASRITGKSYKRTQLAQAQADLTAWIEAMKAALPVIDREAGQ
jgi:hypothetical protein